MELGRKSQIEGQFEQARFVCIINSGCSEGSLDVSNIDGMEAS